MRSAPRSQFGTGNYDESKTEGFFLSPVPGKAKARVVALASVKVAHVAACFLHPLHARRLPFLSLSLVDMF
ncbi:MAG: hypothetical protein SGPRY_012148 [Prymnesium sp.]